MCGINILGGIIKDHCMLLLIMCTEIAPFSADFNGYQTKYHHLPVHNLAYIIYQLTFANKDMQLHKVS